MEVELVDSQSMYPTPRSISTEVMASLQHFLVISRDFLQALLFPTLLYNLQTKNLPFASLMDGFSSGKVGDESDKNRIIAV